MLPGLTGFEALCPLKIQINQIFQEGNFLLTGKWFSLPKLKSGLPPLLFLLRLGFRTFNSTDYNLYVVHHIPELIILIRGANKP